MRPAPHDLESHWVDDNGVGWHETSACCEDGNIVGSSFARLDQSEETLPADDLSGWITVYSDSGSVEQGIDIAPPVNSIPGSSRRVDDI